MVVSAGCYDPRFMAETLDEKTRGILTAYEREARTLPNEAAKRQRLSVLACDPVAARRLPVPLRVYSDRGGARRVDELYLRPTQEKVAAVAKVVVANNLNRSQRPFDFGV